MPALSPNIIIIAILVATGAYGVVAGKSRLRLLILSVYVGIVLAEQLSGVVRPYVHFVGEDQVSLLLLGLPVLIFGFVGGGGKHQPKGSIIANALIGILTGALIVSSALHLLPTSQMAAVDSGSFLAMNIGQFHLWILGLLPVVVILFGLMRGEKKHH